MLSALFASPALVRMQSFLHSDYLLIDKRRQIWIMRKPQILASAHELSEAIITHVPQKKTANLHCQFNPPDLIKEFYLL